MNDGLIRGMPGREHVPDHVSRGFQAVELDYVEIAAPVTITATIEVYADVVVTGGAIFLDGLTDALVEFECPYVKSDTSAGIVLFTIFDNGVPLGRFAEVRGVISVADWRMPVYAKRRLSLPAGWHALSIRAYGAAGAVQSIQAGAGGSGNLMPAYIRTSRVI